MKNGSVCLVLLLVCGSFAPSRAVESPQPAMAIADAPYVPPSFVKVYETSFEGVEMQDDHRLTWNFPHWFEYAARHKADGGVGDGDGGGRMWVETNCAHTGKTSIGLELFDIEKSRRAEFVVFPGKYVSDEYYVSYWLFLPKEWGLFDRAIDWNWYEIGNPYSAAGEPYAAIHIRKPDQNQEYFDVVLCGREQNHQQFEAASKRMRLPKDRWFPVLCYVRRDVTNGAVRLWFDGQYVGERVGYPTMSPTRKEFQIEIAKIYHERGDKVPHKIWIDDFALYTRKTGAIASPSP